MVEVRHPKRVLHEGKRRARRVKALEIVERCDRLLVLLTEVVRVRDSEARDFGEIGKRVLLEHLVVKLSGHDEIAVRELAVGLTVKVAFGGYGRRTAGGREGYEKKNQCCRASSHFDMRRSVVRVGDASNLASFADRVHSPAVRSRHTIK